MTQVSVAFLWHLHQPCYRDLVTGKFLMPWVRLHGIKDYTGMVAILEEFPSIRCAVNFSPVLLEQLEAYIGGATDTMLDLSLVPAKDLTEEQRSAILSTFFMAHPTTVIGAYPRYMELQEMQRRGQKFREQDLLDLQVLANLAWFHSTVKSVEELRQKGRGFLEKDKETLVVRMRETLAALLPRWKALGDRVELTVSPYTHAIVPLLCDFASAREAIPDLSLPNAPSMPEEADFQVRKALEVGERFYGKKPRGMWPSEGSVSTAACDLFKRHGLEWVGTDEDIVGAPGVRSYGGLKIAFRDKALSNLIGFTYKTMTADDAVRDFLGRLQSREGGVPVILDGENPWEHYWEGGVPFLRTLYRALSEHPQVRTAKMGDLEPSGTMDSVFAGSWINRNFGVWIGHEEDRKGWDLVGRAWKDLQGTKDELAWACLRAAEGSDWFWWFGEDFSSMQDAEFDALFRRHLMNVYRVLGRPIPEEMQRSIKRPRREGIFKPPWAMLRVQVDGRRNDYFEWIAAGHYEMAREYGAMSGDAAFIRDIWYGFDVERLLLRLDFRPGVDPKKAMEGGELSLLVTRPRHKVVSVRGVADEIFEAAVPLTSLDAAVGEEVEFFLELKRPGSVPVRFPTLAPLWFKVPSSDFERIEWQV